MKQRRIRVGVVGANGGTDRWGARGHIPAIQALEEAELVAVCTSREETARQAQERTGAPLAFWDYEEMVRSPEIDLVTVAVRISLHRAVVTAALEAGKHVFCEWPLALNSVDAAAMEAMAKERGVRHALGTQARFSPGVVYAKELLDGGYVGRPLLFAMTHFLPTLAGPVPSHRWWTLRGEEGGGAILIATGHALDVARWCLGDPEEVNGRVETVVRETRFSDTGEVVPITAPDTVAFLVRLSGGVTGTVHISTACQPFGGFRLEVYGTEGRLLVESPHMVQYSIARVYGGRRGASFGELPVPERLTYVQGLAPESHAFQVAHLLRSFIRSINEGTEFHPNISDGVSLHRAIETVVRSSESGRWERVG